MRLVGGVVEGGGEDDAGHSRAFIGGRVFEDLKPGMEFWSCIWCMKDPELEEQFRVVNLINL